MQITDEQRHNSLQIESLGGEYSEWEIGIRFSLQINHRGGSLQHRNERVYLDRRQMSTFIEGLEELDEKRQGEVAISTMSPEDIYLGIKAIDDLGHLAVVVRAAQRSFHYQIYQYKLEAEFEIDPTAMPAIITAFKKM